MALIQVLEGLDGKNKPCEDCASKKARGLGEFMTGYSWAALLGGMVLGGVLVFAFGRGKSQTKRSRRSKLGDAAMSAEEHVEAAHRAAEDGDCKRALKQIEEAEKHGMNVVRLRKQIGADCKRAS